VAHSEGRDQPTRIRPAVARPRLGECEKATIQLDFRKPRKQPTTQCNRARISERKGLAWSRSWPLSSGFNRTEEVADVEQWRGGGVLS